MQFGVRGDPSFEGQDYYRRYLLDRSGQPPPTSTLVRDTPCPCLLLELVGAEMRVSALASTCDIQVISQPLTPRLHLYDLLGVDWDHMVVLAKALRALAWSVR